MTFVNLSLIRNTLFFFSFICWQQLYAEIPTILAERTRLIVDDNGSRSAVERSPQSFQTTSNYVLRQASGAEQKLAPTYGVQPGMERGMCP